MKEIKRVVLSGGGTGGHIYPALALLKIMQQRYPEIESLYIGSEKGLEAEIVAKAGIPFQSVEIQGIKRSLSLSNLKTMWLMLTSVSKAKKILKAFQPDVVIGTGGYVCAPVLFAATRLGIPSMIHEQNSLAGLTNKFLSRFVDKIAICFEEAANHFPKYADKVVLTGNPRGQEVIETPVVADVLSQQFQLTDQVPTVLVFGGSRGAPAINEAALAAIPAFKDKPYQVIVATGAAHYEAFTSALTEIPANVRVVPYIDNMPVLLRNVQLVVGRSGATSLTELTALGLPSILVPSPFVTDNHQEHNALSLVNKQAAVMIPQSELEGVRLIEEIDALMLQPEVLAQMAAEAQALGIVDASDRIIQEIQKLTV